MNIQSLSRLVDRAIPFLQRIAMFLAIGVLVLTGILIGQHEHEKELQERSGSRVLQSDAVQALQVARLEYMKELIRFRAQQEMSTNRNEYVNAMIETTTEMIDAIQKVYAEQEAERRK